MKMNKLKFPPFWIGIVFTAIIMLGTCVLIWLGWEPIHPAIDGRLFLLILCFVMISCFVTHTVTEDGISLEFMGIPVRKKLWSEITAAAFLIRNMDGKMGQCYVIFAVYPKRIDALSVSKYMQKGHISSSSMLRLRIPVGHEEHYISELRRCVEQVGNVEVFWCYQ